MKRIITPNPAPRGRLRLYCGKTYFTIKRRISRLTNGVKYARRRSEMLPYVCVAHQTPLIRRLKDADMQLQHNKVINLGIAVPKVHTVTVYPGEVFSYWKCIGRPSRRKGYRRGMVLRNGRVASDIGGGLCQLSNLIYWLTIHTPLTVTERHRHGYDVFPDCGRTQPFGSGATCFYNYIDLCIRNDTDQTYQLSVGLTDSHLTGAWTADAPPQCTYEVYEKEHLIQPEYWGGYTRHNLLYRKKYDAGGQQIADEFVVENHAIMMYSPLLPGKNGE